MYNDAFDLNKLKINKPAFHKISNGEVNDIAIIGMNGKIGLAENLDEYWEVLKNGKTFIRDFPQNRFEDSIGFSIKPIEKSNLIKASYFDDIDKFDYEFFNISLREAKMMDPNQRIFLQCAWSVLEDAGYGGENIKGSRTGVFAGQSNDLRVDYHTYVYGKNKNAYKDISLAGNVKSVLASRIAYILDLKGPTMVVDTACSSTLVAIHLACQSLKNGECEMAIAGGVKINILPIERGIDDEAGIRSQNDITKAFDDDAEGISSGEGVCTLLLKPLDKAILDGDNIKGIIKGSAINQDGNSIGLTAPNDEAQKNVIIAAWKNAGVNPESISHIECHGTGTKLGDPVEISGIEKAFKVYTNKKGFCSIGSNKPNNGHLDNASGIASIMKVLLMIQHKEIPPLINFNKPNSKINFIDSPVYINDRITKWKQKEDKLRCGVSSFGLSGTNCHVVLEEYIEDALEKSKEYKDEYIFTLSARDENLLKDLATKYIKVLETNKEDYPLSDVCYVSNVGRRHNNYRLAFIVSSIDELKNRLRIFLNGNKGLDDKSFFGINKLVSSKKKKLEKFELNEIEKSEIDYESNSVMKIINEDCSNFLLQKICKFYVRGADIKWSEFYNGEFRRKISLPLYPFKKNRCWIEDDNNYDSKEKDKLLLNGIKLPSMDQTIYVSNFTPKDDWVIGDHIINNRYVMPGTAYIEMVVEALRSMGIKGCIEFQDTVFVNQFSLTKEENRDIQVILKENKGRYEFVITSFDESESKWNTHCEGAVLEKKPTEIKTIDSLWIESYIQKDSLVKISEEDSLVDLRGRWTGINKEVYKMDNGYLSVIELSEKYIEDLKYYELHPSLLDRAINASIDIIDEGSYYLPFNYGKLNIHKPVPRKFYSLITEHHRKNREIATLDVTLCDVQGRIIAQAKDYTVKRASIISLENNLYKNMMFSTDWQKIENQKEKYISIDDTVAVICNSGLKEFQFIHELKELGVKVLLIKLESHNVFLYENLNWKFLKKYDSINQLVEVEKVKNIIYVDQEERDLNNIFILVKEIINRKVAKKIRMLILSKNAFKISGREVSINPIGTAIASMLQVIAEEYTGFSCRLLDITDNTDEVIVVNELKKIWTNTVVAYRDHKFYQKRLISCNDIHEDNKNYQLKNHGAYVITGGAGGLGLEVAKHLAAKSTINLILLSRRIIPERTQWESIIRDKKDCKLVKIIEDIKRIENMGSTVSFYSVDVGDEKKLSYIFKEVRSNYGRINGIIHCAGNAGDGFLFKKSKEEFQNVIFPKIKGTRNLDLLTRQDNPDFMVLFSSINSLIGGKGQSDYAAGNAYMDGYSILRNQLGFKTISINWAPWKDVGMAYEYNSYKEDELFNQLDIKDALKLFDIALRNNLSNVVAGQLNKNFFKFQHDEELPFVIEESIMENRFLQNKVLNKSNTSQVIVNIEENKELTEIEMELANIWSKVLQTSELSIYDNFSSLGGDSILATYLYKELEKKYPGIMDITDIFTYSSICEMAEFIEKNMKDNKEEQLMEKGADELDELLSKLANGNISVSQINNILR